jgi:hypothetical protein
MFSFRQSSLPWVVVLPAGKMLAHAVGFVVALRTAGAHAAAGWGGLQRNGPIGGAANGMPRNAHEAPKSTPWTTPLAVATRQETACGEPAVDDDEDEEISAPDSRLTTATAPIRFLIAVPMTSPFAL